MEDNGEKRWKTLMICNRGWYCLWMRAYSDEMNDKYFCFVILLNSFLYRFVCA